MYVKLSYATSFRLLPVHGQVEFGSRAWLKGRDGGDITEATLEELTGFIEETANGYDRTAVYGAPAGRQNGNGEPFWNLRWVRFMASLDESPPGRIVFSTYPIYIMGDDGRTIDRV